MTGNQNYPPPYDEADYRAQCKDKRVYQTKTKARQGVRNFLSGRPDLKGVVYTAYRCDFCRKFHIGRKRKVNKGNEASQYDRSFSVDRPPPQRSP